MHAKFVVGQMILSQAAMEHTGEKLSVGVKMEAYDGEAAANFAANLGRSQAGNIVIANVEWYN